MRREGKRSSSFGVGVATGVTSLVEDNGSVDGLWQCWSGGWVFIMHEEEEVNGGKGEGEIDDDGSCR
jgi:uncharacterized cupin superfamily protein